MSSGGPCVGRLTPLGIGQGMVKVSPVLLVGCASALFVFSCVADVEHEPVGNVVEPSLSHGIGGHSPEPRDPIGDAHAWFRAHPGQCSEACYDARAMLCNDAEICHAADVQPYDVTTCADVGLSCQDVWQAEHGEVAGLEECRQSCQQRR
jgi:hypothetical protein